MSVASKATSDLPGFNTSTLSLQIEFLYIPFIMQSKGSFRLKKMACWRIECKSKNV